MKAMRLALAVCGLASLLACSEALAQAHPYPAGQTRWGAASGAQQSYGGNAQGAPSIAFGGAFSHVPSSPGPPPGVLDPRAASAIDVPLVVTGASFFIVGYVVGSALSFMAASSHSPCCYNGNPDLAFIPFGHWATFELGGAIAGIPATAFEIVGTIMLIVGLVRVSLYLEPGSRAQFDDPLEVRF